MEVEQEDAAEPVRRTLRPEKMRRQTTRFATQAAAAGGQRAGSLGQPGSLGACGESVWDSESAGFTVLYNRVSV